MTRGPPPACAIGATANPSAIIDEQKSEEIEDANDARFPDSTGPRGPAWPLALAGLAGCESKPALAPVKGKVTHAGQPVAGANVMFQPETGIASGGVTGADGRFELQTPNDRRPGAVPGKHLVSILKPASEPPPPKGGSAQPPPPPGRPWSGTPAWKSARAVPTSSRLISRNKRCAERA